ncbi:MAG: hypothetical protein JRH06_14060 [Deltaproteobacteria bacterium]|nr:hypothetical protein [Deltaproteobacteria bacterium]MBW2138665.1 hypothetical protein [Deltaproteobacteria bacterium]
MVFQPSSREGVRRAIGDTRSLPPSSQRALTPAGDFAPIPIPKRGDWLAEHFEPGQTFGQFVGMSPARADRSHNKIYLQPLGYFKKGQSPSLEKLELFAARPLFLCPVCLRKLQFSIGFHIVNRYRQLFHFYKMVGFGEEAGWISRRLARIIAR